MAVLRAQHFCKSRYFWMSFCQYVNHAACKEDYPSGIFICRGTHASKFWPSMYYFMAEISLLSLSGCNTSNGRNSLPHYRGEKKVFCLGWEFLSGVSYTFLWKCLQSDWTWQVTGLIYMTTATFLRKLCVSICVPRKMQIGSTFYFFYPIKVSLSASGILRILNSMWL